MSSLLAQLTSIRGGSLTPVFGLLIDTALKGSLLILAAAIVVYFLRGRSAAARHAAWSAAVIGHLALPILTLLVPQWRLPLLPAPPWIDTPAQVSAPQLDNQSAQIQLVGEQSDNAAPVTSAPAASVTNNENPATTTTPIAGVDRSRQSTIASVTKKWPLLSALGLLWIVGTMLVLLRLAIGTWRVGRLAKNGDRVDDGDWLSLTQRIAKGLGITRPLTLLRGNSLAVPVTWGVVYPAVLLPPDAGEWPEARRRFVLVHEMAHVKRFDALTQLVAQITIAMLWFDPLIWIAAHRMRVEREHACDDYVLRDGTTPSLYAGELLEMVQSIGSPRHDSAAPAFAALAMARRSEFEGRMLAILDPRQNRHTLGRTSAVVASVALALLVLPLAALRPFDTSAAGSASTVALAPKTTATPLSDKPAAAAGSKSERLSATACDSVARVKDPSHWTHIHVTDPQDQNPDHRLMEYLNSSAGHCAHAVVLGTATFANDRLISLAPESFASFREMTASGDRLVRVLPGDGGVLQFIPSLNGRRTTYDDDMRAWMGRFVPEVMRESGVDAPQRVARDLARGGVTLVLANIARTKSNSSKRVHYEALLDGRPLTEAEYSQISKHASRNLYGSSRDLDAVLTRIGAGPAAGTKGLKQAVARLMVAQEAMGEALGVALDKNRSSSESASTMTQYASTDDPEMVLLALQGAKEISSDTDRRLLLQALAPRALRRKSAVLRKAYFDATNEMSSDSDRRIVLQSALPYGHSDSAVTLAVFKSVAEMSSDTDKRLVLQTAADQRLLATSEIRNAFMVAAKTISNSTDYTLVVQSALKQ